MTEVKHNFLKSKMNKDLDPRLMQDGEYRDALNIGVNRSEGPNAGVIENIIGTAELTAFEAIKNNLKIANVSVIGYVKDSTTSRIYVFLTDYTDTSTNHLDNFAPANIEDPALPDPIISYGAFCAIVMWDINTQTATTLVEGNFINFSKTHKIYGVNILENLLCWTDNRNQPRKINLLKANPNNLAIPTYYTTEDNISVAKYYPYETMKLVVPDYATGTGFTSSLITASKEWNPTHFVAEITSIGVPNSYQLRISPDGGNLPATPACLLVESSLLTGGSAFYEIKVENAQHPEDGWLYVTTTEDTLVAGTINTIRLTKQDGTGVGDIAVEFPNWSINDQLMFSYSNPDYDSNYSGDPKFLEDKFVRLSYRFKYDDDEYSLMAPFTQSAFIPKQWGSLLSGNNVGAGGTDATVSDEFKMAESGIVGIMENQVDNIICNIPLPTVASNLDELLHVDKIEILMKESNSNVVKVVDTLDKEVYSRPRELTVFIKFGAGMVPTNGFFINLPFNKDLNDYIGDYVYLSDGTQLLEDATLDPVFISSILPPNPASLAPLEHEIIFSSATNPGAALVVIPNNRTPLTFRKSSTDSYILYDYQSTKPWQNLTTADTVRVSDKIPIRALAQEVTGNRIVYGNYINKHTPPTYLDYEIKVSEKNPITLTPVLSVDTLQYPTQTLKQNRSYQVGFVLADRYGRQSSVITRNPNNVINELWRNDTVFADYTNSEILGSGLTDPITWPGNSLKLLLNQTIPDVYNAANYPGLWSETNPLGWYSYKLVVKQQDQEYYNVYLPGALTGRILWESLGTGSEPTYVNTSRVSNISLYGDNINKVPRELNEVGPSDVNYGSTVDLWPRIIPNPDYSGATWKIFANNQSPRHSEKAGIISMKNFRDLGAWATTKGDFTPDGASSPFYPFDGTKFIDPLFNADEDPMVATLSVNYQIGLNKADQENIPIFSNALTVFETTPTYSNLPLYYESSTSGLISALNEEVVTGVTTVPTQTSPLNWSFTEAVGPNNYVTNEFELLDVFLSPIGDPTLVVEDFTVTGGNGVVLAKVVNGISNVINPQFELVTTQQIPYPKWRIKTNIDFPYYGTGGPDVQYNFYMKVSTAGISTPITWQNTMGNEPPCLWHWPLSSTTWGSSGACHIPIWMTTSYAATGTDPDWWKFHSIGSQTNCTGCSASPNVLPNNGTMGPFFADASIACGGAYPPSGVCPQWYTNGCFAMPGTFPNQNPNVVGGGASVFTKCTELHFTPGCITHQQIFKQLGPPQTLVPSASPIDHANPIIDTSTTSHMNQFKRISGTIPEGQYQISFRLEDEGQMLSNDEYIVWVWVRDWNNPC